MQKFLLFFLLSIFLIPVSISEAAPLPAAPHVNAVATTPARATPGIKTKATPVTLTIPAIGLIAPIEGLGLTEDGAMDVPNGSTGLVGWYKNGTVPGDLGSAVMDAHVYAAFKNLHEAKAGDDVYVTMSDGTKQHFVIEDSEVSPLADTSSADLFEKRDRARLNLITCAGIYRPELGTYDKRLVVHASLQTGTAY